jgi:ubiquinone/menaquinone biosynthesis C-methylase UbiE
LTGFAPTLNGLLNHYDHLCRDWSFGRLEIHQQMQLLEPLIPAGPAMPAVVLGCGGARLPFELQQSKRVGPLLCIDINPVLLESARLITGGSKLTLPEFPLAPILDSEPALIRTCARPPEAAEPEIVWALGDVHALPLASGSVEFLLTPFLIDILDQPVSHLIRELARVLKPGGVWLNIGTLFFQRLAERERLSMSELMDLASENGLEIEEQSTSVIGYLNSPASGHRRSEQTWAWRARRKDNASSPDLRAKSSASRTPRIVISSPGDLERAELILTAKAQLVGWLKERWPVTSSGPLSLDLAEVSRAAAQAWSLEIEQATALVSEILRQELPGAVTSEPV